MESSLVEGGLNVTLTIRLLMHGKVSVTAVIAQLFSTLMQIYKGETMYTSNYKLYNFITMCLSINMCLCFSSVICGD